MLHLLPKNHKKLVHAEYRKRLGVVIGASVAIICILGIIFLLPSYFISNVRYQDIKTKEATIQTSIASYQTGADGETIKKISDGLIALKPLGSTTTASEAFKRFLFDIGNQSIKVSFIDYVLNSDNSVTLDVAANAATRDDLQTFIDVLKNDKYFSGVSLPLSDFVKDKDLDFSLKIKVVGESATSTSVIAPK